MKVGEVACGGVIAVDQALDCPGVHVAVEIFEYHGHGGLVVVLEG